MTDHQFFAFAIWFVLVLFAIYRVKGSVDRIADMLKKGQEPQDRKGINHEA